MYFCTYCMHDTIHSLVISTSCTGRVSEVSMFKIAVDERQVFSSLAISVFRPVWPTEKPYTVACFFKLIFLPQVMTTVDVFGKSAYELGRIFTVLWIYVCTYMYNVYEIFLRKNCTSVYFAIKDTIANSGHKVHCAAPNGQYKGGELLLLIPKGQQRPLRHCQYRWDKFSALSKYKVNPLRLILQKIQHYYCIQISLRHWKQLPNLTVAWDVFLNKVFKCFPIFVKNYHR